MRILAKILLFPVVVALTILVAVSRFICSLSGAVLTVLASLFFIAGLAVLVLLRDRVRIRVSDQPLRDSAASELVGG